MPNGIAEIEALAAASAREKERRKARIAMLSGVHAAYRRMFLNADGETLTADGETVLADLCEVARIGKSQVLSSDAELRTVEGMRHLFTHLLSRLDLDSAPLRRLGARLKERDDD